MNRPAGAATLESVVAREIYGDSTLCFISWGRPFKTYSPTIPPNWLVTREGSFTPILDVIRYGELPP